MGEVREKITLINQSDMVKRSIGYIQESEVRQLTVDAVVDTGAWRLVMGEEACRQLGLAIVQDSEATLAGGVRRACKITEPVEIRWKDRFASCHALVLPGKEEILLGVIPIEDMDLKVNPVDACLAGAHGENWVHYVR
jgi:clan AA aspartic protease